MSLRFTGVNKNEIVRSGSRRIYHIPEADALGLENRAEITKIKAEAYRMRIRRIEKRIRNQPVAEWDFLQHAGSEGNNKYG